jgi:hypothetical protein
MSTIKSSTEHLTLNADGSGKDIKFQANGVEKASISSTGAFTSTSIDATKLSGALPAIDGSALTNMAGSEGFAVGFASAGWQSLSAGTVVPFDNDSGGDRYDDGSNFNTTTSKYTAPTTGVYMFWWFLYTAQTDTDGSFTIVKNGASVDYMQGTDYFMKYSGHSNDFVLHASLHVKVNAGETIYITAASTSDVYTGHSAFGGCRLS